MEIKKLPTFPTLMKKKQVAAYARVSSGKDAMLHSLSAQISYYSAYIQKRPEWLYRGVYVDEAITGKKCDDRVAGCVRDAWGIRDDDLYDEALERLEIAVCDYLDAHPELRQAPNSEDMWDSRDRYEDVDDEEDDYYDGCYCDEPDDDEDC